MTIQFKGAEIKQTPPLITNNPNKVKSITYTNVVGSEKLTNPNAVGNYRMGYDQTYEASEQTESLVLHDNTQAYT